MGGVPGIDAIALKKLRPILRVTLFPEKRSEYLDIMSTNEFLSVTSFKRLK